MTTNRTKTKTKPTTKRPTPADRRRMGELVSRNVTPEEEEEREGLLTRFLEWAEFRDKSGTVTRQPEGKACKSIEHRKSRVLHVRDWQRTRDRRTLDATRGERDATARKAGDVLRNNLVLSPGAMPEGAIGDALRALAPDARQIVNLRLTRNARGKRLSFREVAEQFRRNGKGGKTYTGERCRQIYRDAMQNHPALAPYVEGLTHRNKVALDERKRSDRWNDASAADEIHTMTTDARFDKKDLADKKATVFSVVAHPRRPLNLQTSRR